VLYKPTTVGMCSNASPFQPTNSHKFKCLIPLKQATACLFLLLAPLNTPPTYSRHLEVWFGAMGIGAVVHTLNPRLSDHDLSYIINHAGDAYIAVDVSLAPILRRILKDCPSVKGVIILTDRWAGWAVHIPLPRSHCKHLFVSAQASYHKHGLQVVIFIVPHRPPLPASLSQPLHLAPTCPIIFTQPCPFCCLLPLSSHLPCWQAAHACPLLLSL
jgi:hypothetical protein